MNSFDTLFYLMGSKPYVAKQAEKLPDREILIIGSVPSWLDDLKLLLPGYVFKKASRQDLRENSVALVTQQGMELPQNIVVLNALSGKKHLWNSLLSSGLLS